MYPKSSLATSQSYRVAGDNQFPPYEYVDEEGIYRGFNVDILKAISLVSGMEFEFYPMKWEEAYRAIDKGQADIIQGMKESEFRKGIFSFSDSLLISSQSIFVLDEENSINSLDSLKNKKVALNKEDSEYTRLKIIKGIEILEFDSFSQAIDALIDKEVDAAEYYLQIENFDINQILEKRLLDQQ